MAWTFCTSGAAVRKAGVNANSTISSSGAALKDWSNQAEGMINAETRQDWTTDFSSVGTEFKEALSEVATSKIAMNIISYDMSGFTSRIEAQVMLDVHENLIRKGIAKLKDKNIQKTMGLSD